MWLIFCSVVHNKNRNRINLDKNLSQSNSSFVCLTKTRDWTCSLSAKLIHQIYVGMGPREEKIFRLSIVPLISVHQKALVGNWCRIYGIIFKLEGVMEFSLCSYLDGRGHFKAHSSNSRRNGTERRDLGLLHVYVHWLTSMYPHNGCRVFSWDAQN